MRRLAHIVVGATQPYAARLSPAQVTEAELRKKAKLPPPLCWGCLTEIEIGEPYVKVPLNSGPVAVAHHYHAECYKVMRALRRRRQREKRARRATSRST
jgi:hypothetical protein